MAKEKRIAYCAYQIGKTWSYFSKISFHWFSHINNGSKMPFEVMCSWLLKSHYFIAIQFCRPFEIESCEHDGSAFRGTRRFREGKIEFNKQFMANELDYCANFCISKWHTKVSSRLSRLNSAKITMVLGLRNNQTFGLSNFDNVNIMETKILITR